MSRYIVILLALVAFTGCDNGIEAAKTAVEAQLVHKQTVEYSDLEHYPGKVICGKINAAGAWGEGAGYKPFVVVDGLAETAPSDDDLAIFCSQDPAAALLARLGIGPMDETNPDLLLVQKHLNQLDSALRLYLENNPAYPPTKPGLQRLLSPNTATRTAHASPYIESIPVDPWGRPYHYEKPRQLHGTTSKYKLYTLGKNGVEGGQGENADISNLHLKYLNHIANL